MIFFHTFTPSFQSVAKSSKKYFSLGATSLVKIGEVGLSGEIGGGVKFRKKTNFIITIRYEILTFSSVGPFFEEWGRGSRKFWPEAEILGIFSFEVAPNMCGHIEPPTTLKLHSKALHY